MYLEFHACFILVELNQCRKTRKATVPRTMEMIAMALVPNTEVSFSTYQHTMNTNANDDGKRDSKRTTDVNGDSIGIVKWDGSPANQCR